MSFSVLCVSSRPVAERIITEEQRNTGTWKIFAKTLRSIKAFGYDRKGTGLRVSMLSN